MNTRLSLREGLIWTSFSKYLSRILSIISTLVLAKFLTPEDFGIVAISIAIIQGLQIFRDNGVSASIITDKENNQELINTGASIFFGFGIVVFFIAIIFAPRIAHFFDDQRLINSIRFMSISLLFSSFSMMHSTQAQKNLKFKKNAVPEIFSQIIYIFLSIVFAYLGMGYWSIIYSFVISTIIKTILFFVLYPLKISIIIDINCLRRIYSFSIFSFINAILIFLLLNLDRIIIGKVLNMEQVGYYFFAFKIANIPAEYLYSIVISILLPYFSRLSIEKLRQRYIETVHYLAIIILPVSFFILIITKPFFIWLYQDKWMPVIPLIQILIFYGIIRSLFGPMGTYIYARRKPIVQMYFLILQSIISYGTIIIFWNKLNAILVAFIFTGTLALQFIFWIIYAKLNEKIEIYKLIKNIGSPILVSIFCYSLTKIIVYQFYLEPFLKLIISTIIYLTSISFIYTKIYKVHWYKFSDFLISKPVISKVEH